MDPTADEIDALIANHPLGIVVSVRQSDALSTPLPLVLDRSQDPEGVLHGHFSAGNPQVAQLRSDPLALILFQGPGAYVSPSWLEDRTQAPSWFYTFVEFLVEIEFLDCAAERKDSLTRLVDRFEEGRPAAWNLGELQHRYEPLASGIRPFRAWVLRTRGRFKLGQDDRADVFSEWTQGLEQDGQHALATMARKARGRGGRP
jgi:transcriptional regulator